jgi:ABC-type phosphate/phosphonate transport system permease subunit
MKPTNKVALGLAVGAVITIAAWVAKQFGGVELPVEIQAAGQALLTFVAQYFVPDTAASDDDDAA